MNVTNETTATDNQDDEYFNVSNFTNSSQDIVDPNPDDTYVNGSEPSTNPTHQTTSAKKHGHPSFYVSVLWIQVSLVSERSAFAQIVPPLAHIS